MTTLSTFQVTDDVTDNLASHHNRLLGSLLRTEFTNAETLAATKELSDGDTPFQIYNLTGNQTVELPPEATTNHPFLIYNTDASDTLTVKDDAGAITFATLTADQFGYFVQVDGEGWKQINSSSISEALLSFTDITTNNRSTTKHGLASKFPNAVMQLEYGDGNWRNTGIVKAANETVNNSATLQNDDDFLFSIAANEKWFVEIFAVVTSVSVNSDFKCDFTVPASCTGWFSGQGTGNMGWGVIAAASSPTALNSLTSALAAGSINGTYGIHIIAIILNSTNAGTVQFRWAQNTATAENTVVNAGSFMRMMRIG